MPKYARFDPAQAAPQPVIGWYDTDLLPYKLPAADTLLELSDAEWQGRWANPESGWSVQDGRLIQRPASKELPA